MASADDYKVVFSPQSIADMDALQQQDREKAVAFAKRLTKAPPAGGSLLKHQSGNLWRKKLGRLRVMFTIDKQTKLIVIRVVDLRSDDTYKGLDDRLNWKPED